MVETQIGADEPDRFEGSGPLIEAGEDAFYRGGDRAVVQVPERRAWLQPRSLECGRPPAWMSGPLLLVALLDGFLVYATAWSLLGEHVLAVPLATLVGLGVAFGTVVAGSLAWTRVSEETVPADR